MNAELRKSPCCFLCGASRKPSELNGSVLVGGSWDYSSAYCSRIAQCDSDDSASKIDDLLENLSDPSSTSDTSNSIPLAALSAPDPIHHDYLVDVFIEQLEVIESQIDDPDIGVKHHFGLVYKSSMIIELYQSLCPEKPVPGRLLELSKLISDSFFS